MLVAGFVFISQNCYRAINKVREKFTADLIQAELDIRLQNPLLSLVKSWMDKQLSDVKVMPIVCVQCVLCISV